MQSPSDASLLKCMETDCKELNLKAQFLHHLPDISLLTKRLTVLNLSFNMLKVPVLYTSHTLNQGWANHGPWPDILWSAITLIILFRRNSFSNF